MFGTLDQAAQPVTPKLQLDLQAILERYGISACYAFGSRAREIAARLKGPSYCASAGRSDLDIGIEPIRGRKLSVKEKVKLGIELEDLFRVPRVDLVMVSEADPFLALDIVRGELIYCRDRDQQAEHELYILRRAADLAPFQRARMRQVLEGGER